MRNLLIGGLLSGIALLTWLIAGRRLVTLLDAVTLAVVERIAVEHAVYETSSLEMNGKHVDVMNSGYVRQADIKLSPTGRAVFESSGRQFPLGPGHETPGIGSVPMIEFTKDPGDDVQLTVEQSRLAWPTPFEMNFMTGSSPWQKRNAYMRLRWNKPSGAKLELLWQTDQSYYRTDGWSPPQIKTIIDGLIQIKLQEPKRG